MTKPGFSLEVFPPKRTSPVGTVYDTLDGLEGIHPDFISVTYGTGKQSDRTATARFAHTITREYNLPAVAHLTALYATEADIDEAVAMFQEAGVRAILALRGDVVEGREPVGRFHYAYELIEYLRKRYPEFTLYAACYPEKHPQASSMEADLDALARKVDAGADHLITQLFFDNNDFYRFVDAVRDRNITVPIEAGIMPVSQAHQIRRMTSMCSAQLTPSIEEALRVYESQPEQLRHFGMLYACNQIADLVVHGVDGIHLYTMNQPALSRKIWNNVQSFFDR